MKIVRVEISNAVEKYLQRIRPLLPSEYADLPDNKLIEQIMEQSALMVENIPDSQFGSFVMGVGDYCAKAADNPDNTIVISLPKS